MEAEKAYKIELIKSQKWDLLSIGFGKPADNNEIVKDATDILEGLKITAGGELIKINGPASLPVAVVIAHAMAHRYKAVAVYDPKMGKYIVCIAHGGQYKIGDVIE